MNTGRSSVTILGMLKFFSVFMSIWFFVRLGSFFFRELVIISTDLMVRKF